MAKIFFERFYLIFWKGPQQSLSSNVRKMRVLVTMTCKVDYWEMKLYSKQFCIDQKMQLKYEYISLSGNI